MCKNAIREQIQQKHISLEHIDGTVNLADLFTKDGKNVAYFVMMRNSDAVSSFRLC